LIPQALPLLTAGLIKKNSQQFEEHFLFIFFFGAELYGLKASEEE
jgi:hypothetical protein